MFAHHSRKDEERNTVNIYFLNLPFYLKRDNRDFIYSKASRSADLRYAVFIGSNKF